MTPRQFFEWIMIPSYSAWIEYTQKVPVGDNAELMMLAIAGQESNWTERRQIGGPARGFWQFEESGGIACLMRLDDSTIDEDDPDFVELSREFCVHLSIPVDTHTVYEAIAWNDVLAFGFARLLLWSDPAALPPVGAETEAWHYYLRTWQPGKPDPARWASVYWQAVTVVYPDYYIDSVNV
jgi:hypothetical protein